MKNRLVYALQVILLNSMFFGCQRDLEEDMIEDVIEDIFEDISDDYDLEIDLEIDLDVKQALQKEKKYAINP